MKWKEGEETLRIFADMMENGKNVVFRSFCKCFDMCQENTMNSCNFWP